MKGLAKDNGGVWRREKARLRMSVGLPGQCLPTILILLEQAGVDEEDAHVHAEGVRGGSTLVTVRADEAVVSCAEREEASASSPTIYFMSTHTPPLR